MGVMNLKKQYSEVRLEQAAQRALHIDNYENSVLPGSHVRPAFQAGY